MLRCRKMELGAPVRTGGMKIDERFYEPKSIDLQDDGARCSGIRRRHHGELGALAGATKEDNIARCYGTKKMIKAVCPHDLQEDQQWQQTRASRWN
jgi:hypothetical protein